MRRRESVSRRVLVKNRLYSVQMLIDCTGEYLWLLTEAAHANDIQRCLKILCGEDCLDFCVGKASLLDPVLQQVKDGGTDRTGAK